MKRITTFTVALVLLSGTVSRALAQAPIVPTEPVTLRAPAELDQLLAPIALYPDPLIAEILPAATQPSEIVLADRYLSAGGDINQVDYQPWDGSVKGLARYPNLLRWLADNLVWTTQLGQAFLYQQGDTMDAIQRLRARALALGNLVSTPQQTVMNDNGLIEIVPANPQTVYLPVYQPDVVYVQRAPQPGGYITFGIGLPIGVWLNHDFDWHSHRIDVWHHDHPRPSDWWYRRPADRARDLGTVGVWHPHGPSTRVSERDREDRGWGRAVRPPVTVQHVEARRVPERVVAPPREEPRREIEPRVNPRPPPAVRPPEHREAEPRNVPRPEIERHEAARPAPEPRSIPSHPGGVSSSRPASGALIGVQSAPETHQFSVRGQQSRQGVAQHESAPARPVAPASAPAARPANAPASQGERNRR